MPGKKKTMKKKGYAKGGAVKKMVGGGMAKKAGPVKKKMRGGGMAKKMKKGGKA